MISNKKEICFYVVVVETKDGFNYAPTFIIDDYDGWENDWHEAIEYYRSFGYVSTVTGKDLYDAGVTDLAMIKDWRTIKRTNIK